MELTDLEVHRREGPYDHYFGKEGEFSDSSHRGQCQEVGAPYRGVTAEKGANLGGGSRTGKDTAGSLHRMRGPQFPYL